MKLITIKLKKQKLKNDELSKSTVFELKMSRYLMFKNPYNLVTIN